MSLEVDMHLLIFLIQRYPYLYDSKDKDYKNNELKEKCWEAISMEVSIPVEDCKRLWRNLRDRFNKEKRVHQSEAKESTWPYYQKMLFYAKYANPRKTVVATSKISLSRPGSSPSESNLWGSLELTSQSIEPDPKEEFVATTLTQTDPSTSYEPSNAWEYVDSEPPSKRIKQENMPEELEDGVAPVPTNIQVLKSDVNDHFGAYVVSRLKEMDPQLAKEKRKTMLLILEEEN